MRDLAGAGEEGNPLGIDLDEEDTASQGSSLSRGDLQKAASNLSQQVPAIH